MAAAKERVVATGPQRLLRMLCLLGALACGLGNLLLFWGATAFPSDRPLSVVDARLIEELRAQPGLHRALAPDYKLEVDLELVDDPFNRSVYGTEIDLREPRPRRAIHIQKLGPRLAIHADNYNPKAGWGCWLLHGTLDVPMVPLGVGFLFCCWLFLRLGRAR